MLANDTELRAAQKRPPKHERETTASPASEQEAKEAPDLRSALARWEDEGGQLASSY